MDGDDTSDDTSDDTTSNDDTSDDIGDETNSSPDFSDVETREYLSLIARRQGRLAGDKVNLPIEYLEQMTNNYDFPLTFFLAFRRKILSCGVLEFTAAPGTVEISEVLLANLGSNVIGQVVTLVYSPISKATSLSIATIIPLAITSTDLEVIIGNYLKSFTTITKGLTFNVLVNGQSVPFTVTSMTPSRFAKLIDVDVSSSIIYPCLVPQQIEKFLILNQPFQHTFTAEETQYHISVICPSSPPDAKSVPLRLRFDISSGSGWCFLSYSARLPEVLHHDLVIVDEEEITLDFRNCFLSVVPCESPLAFSLLLSFGAPEASSPFAQSTGSSAPTAPCPYCFKLVPLPNFEMHKERCQRLMVKCPIASCQRFHPSALPHVHCSFPECQAFLPRGNVSSHQAFYHGEHTCFCGGFFKYSKLKSHLESCFSFPVKCRYCFDQHKRGEPPENYRDLLQGLTRHEAYCGSKTVVCHDCGQPVLLKEMDIHMRYIHQKHQSERQFSWHCLVCSTDNSDLLTHCSSCNNPRGLPVHAIDSRSQASQTDSEWICRNCQSLNLEPDLVCLRCRSMRHLESSPCANHACTHRAASTGEAGQIKLCSECFYLIIYPHNTRESLTVYLINQYELQLTTGCSNHECRNKWCRRTQEFEDVPLIRQQLVEKGLAEQPAFYVCVNHKPPYATSADTLALKRNRRRESSKKLLDDTFFF